MVNLPQLEKTEQITRIAVLTSGGDAPGMNAAVRAVTRAALRENIDVIGAIKGYKGLIKGDFKKLNFLSVSHIVQHGGTVLKTDRSDDFRTVEGRKKAAEQLTDRGIEALVVIGGNGSLTGAHLFQQESGIPVIGLPGTIDNDIYGTDETIGFDTAVNTAVEAIDRIRDTANSHERLFLVEVMGRNSGFIAAEVGISGGAESIIVPEQACNIAALCEAIENSISKGKSSSIVVVAEGDNPNHIHEIAAALNAEGYPPRICILGHTQRGGRPTARDRFLASVLGATSIDFLLAGQSDIMVGLRENHVVPVSLKDIASKTNTFNMSLLNIAERIAN